MIDIPTVRENLGVPANRTLPNGKPYHTLPVIQDQSTGKIIGDSFEIALYLDKTYPDSPRLIHPGTTGLTAAFNAQVDGLFTKYITLPDQMALDERLTEQAKKIFAERMGTDPYAQSNPPTAEDREKTWTQFENAMGELVKAYYHVGGTTDYFWSATGTAPAQAQSRGREQVGPYLDGDDEPAYADLIVGAWLAMLWKCMKPQDWQRVRGMQGGIWGRLHDTLEPLREIK